MCPAIIDICHCPPYLGEYAKNNVLELEFSEHWQRMISGEQAVRPRRHFSENIQVIVPLLFDDNDADSNIVAIWCTSYPYKRILYIYKTCQ